MDRARLALVHPAKPVIWAPKIAAGTPHKRPIFTSFIGRDSGSKTLIWTWFRARQPI